MTRWLICALATAGFVLAGDIDYAAMAKQRQPVPEPGTPEKACADCYSRCPKFGGEICRLHCQSRAGCPPPVSAPKVTQ